jgi:hypothetical protein
MRPAGYPLWIPHKVGSVSKPIRPETGRAMLQASTEEATLKPGGAVAWERRRRRC